MSELFDVSTDTILLRNPDREQENPNPLHLGSVYLVVKDFEKSVEFYEKFLGVKETDCLETSINSAKRSCVKPFSVRSFCI
mgnify:CR=1 FL=1